MRAEGSPLLPHSRGITEVREMAEWNAIAALDGGNTPSRIQTGVWIS